MFWLIQEMQVLNSLWLQSMIVYLYAVLSRLLEDFASFSLLFLETATIYEKNNRCLHLSFYTLRYFCAKKYACVCLSIICWVLLGMRLTAWAFACANVILEIIVKIISANTHIYSVDIISSVIFFSYCRINLL